MKRKEQDINRNEAVGKVILQQQEQGSDKECIDLSIPKRLKSGACLR